ncbi:MAG: Asp23/Gls24 family envelope stress response protein [Ruminococcus sp.]|nr:Asp23/Gls24 family envelope stress response protein [Ruminococcus sp.]
MYFVQRRITMDGIKKTQQGTLKVSEDVIETIIRLAVKDTEGVASLQAPAVDIKKMIFSKYEKSDAIKVKLAGDSVQIDVSVAAKYGYKISALGESLQERIKNDVQSMTGVMVSRINVTVANLVFETAEENK